MILPGQIKQENKNEYPFIFPVSYKSTINNSRNDSFLMHSHFPILPNISALPFNKTHPNLFHFKLPHHRRSLRTPPFLSSRKLARDFRRRHRRNYCYSKLYEIDDNPKRREFLDDLFAFMQKRGTPINRLPIMAKQVLDLYELYNLVCARGGLVEVVNKKQWQEIIKGLGLPSSITSAAFTLRTQYTKYLYPLECSQKNFSSADELQASIDGNKREGRRGSYGNFEGPPMSHGLTSSQMSPLSLVQSGPRHLPPHSPPQKQSPGAPDPIAALEMTRMALWKLYQQGGQNQLPPFMQNLPLDFLQKQNMDLLQKQNLPLDILPPLQASPRPPSQEAAINLHVAEQRRKDERQIREEEESRRREEQAKERLAVMDREHKEKLEQQREGREKELRERLVEREDERPSKKLRLEGTPRQANISMSSSEDEQGDKSMAISMEINGVTYSGVLYARPS